MKKKITVIGNGALSLSIATQMGSRGGEIVYVDVRDGILPQAAPVVHVTGKQNYDVRFHEITNSYQSVREADVVIVAVTASFHDQVFANILPFIRDGQLIVFFPACFGAINFLAALRDQKMDITTCEAVSFPSVCEMQSQDTLYVQNIKSCMRVAVKPKERTEETLALLNVYFDIFEPAQNFLETSLDNMNMTLHPLPLLLNVGAAERRGKDFYHYIEGISPTVGLLMEQLDQERMSIGEAFGLQLSSAYDQLVTYYGERGLKTLSAYASSEKGPYTAVKGYGLNSRYVVEDVPYLLVAAASLGKNCGIPTPIMDICINLASAIMQTDYIKYGYSLEKMGLGGLTKEEIYQRV